MAQPGDAEAARGRRTQPRGIDGLDRERLLGGSDRVVDDTLRRLRKKMHDLNIHTIYGYGYRLG